MLIQSQQAKITVTVCRILSGFIFNNLEFSILVDCDSVWVYSHFY